jgi:hypothetical protein
VDYLEAQLHEAQTELASAGAASVAPSAAPSPARVTTEQAEAAQVEEVEIEEVQEEEVRTPCDCVERCTSTQPGYKHSHGCCGPPRVPWFGATVRYCIVHGAHTPVRLQEVLSRLRFSAKVPL